MFNSIRENTLHIFGAVNFLAIPMVWAFYPETANRTLEEMDHLFMSKSPFVWDEEAYFRKWKEGTLEDREKTPPVSQQNIANDIKVDDSELKEKV